MAKTLSDLKNSPVEKITLGFIEDAIKLTHSSFIKEKVAYNFIKKGWIDLETSNYIPALKSFNRALKIFIQKEDLKGYLLSKHGIATIYRSVSKFDKALAIYFDILDRLETEKTDLRFITLKDIAACYYDWGSYKNCLEYLKMAKEIIKNGDSIFQQIYIYYNLGKAYIKLGDLSRAQEKLFMALTLCDSNNINYKICESLTQLGNVFRKQQNYSRSESFHIRALQYAKSARDYSAHINVLINIGSLAYYSGEYKKGLQYLLTTLEEIEHVHDKYHFLLKTYHYLYVTYKELNDNKSALEYLQKSVLLKENERERLQKIHFNLLNIELKFIIKSEEFIIKKREVTEDFNSEASEELIVLLQEKIKDVIGFTNLTINTIDKFSRKINQTSIDNHQYIKSVSFNGKDSPILDSIENNREIVIYNKEMAEKDLKINISKLTKNMESFIILPIKRGQNVVAAISIEDIDKGKYTQYELNTLKTVSAYISLSIENLRIKKEVESLNALMDEDTIIIEANELSTNLPPKDRESGLPQRALFTELLIQQIKGTKRNNGKLAVYAIHIDLEFEKRDSFISEDIIIGEHTTTERLKNSLRSEDVLSKDSDDSYILAIKMDSIRGCKTVAKKLVNILKEPIFTENQKITPKIKIGITMYPNDFLTPNELIDRAKKCAEKISKENITGYEFCDQVHNISSID